MAKFILKYGDGESPHFITREVEIETTDEWESFSSDEKTLFLQEQVVLNTTNGASGASQVFIFLQEIA